MRVSYIGSEMIRSTGTLSMYFLIKTPSIWCSFSGISGKSQILFSVVYTARYLDLLTNYISAYNTFMKMVFIMASYATVYLMYVKFKATYDHNHDTFRIEFLLIPTLVLALLINHEFTVMEVSMIYVCSHTTLYNLLCIVDCHVVNIVEYRM